MDYERFRVRLKNIANWDNNAPPLVVEWTVKISSVGTPAGRRMLVRSTVFESTEPAAFEPARRVNPIYFQYP